MDFREVSEQRLEKMYLGGKTRLAIAKQFGVTENQVRNRLENAGIFKRYRKPSVLSKEELQGYIDQGLWEKEIAEIVGCSPDHLRRLRRRYGIPAKQLILNKRPVDIEKWTLTSKQKEMLIGTLMGDSSIIPVRGSFRFSCGHCEQQRRYLEYKRDLLKPFSWDLRPQTKVLNGKTFKGFKLETFTHPEFQIYRKLFYGDGTKVYSRIVDLLTPTSLAFWMMDDGTASGKRLILGFHTERNELVVVRNVIQKKFGITLKVFRQNPNLFGLGATTKESRYALASLIQPYFHPSMVYKIQKWISDNPEPSLIGNDQEGATTRSSLNPQRHGDKDHLRRAISVGSAADPNSTAVGHDIV